MRELRRREAAWKKRTASAPERHDLFTTLSGIPIQRVYTPSDVAEDDYLERRGLPGEYPFTRGIHATGYRGRRWTMRMFAGFGAAEETNQRFKYLLSQGQTGLSVAFDLPTLMGYDTDHPLAQGEFGRCGVAVSSLADMEVLFDGIPLGAVSTSMTINGPAPITWAMYLATAEKQGVALAGLRGTIQNDILKEYIAQNEFIFPPEPSMRLVVDTIEYAVRAVPQWNPISISGYHIREAGSTAAQELAFTLADGFAYVQACLERGMDVDDFAPRLSFFFNVHNDFFEEVAKFRAARRIWARAMRHRFGARNERSWWMRTHAQTAGCALTAQAPENNVERVALQALAAVLGGAQSLHTNSLDEAYALPSEDAATIALRTQQIIAHESGVANAIDPLGGSYLVERLTDELEAQALDYFSRIDAMGGVIPAIDNGFFQQEIAEASFRYQREVERKDRIIVGVNEYATQDPVKIPLLAMDKKSQRRQLQRLRRVRRERDRRAVSNALEAVGRAARGDENLMPAILAAVKAYATLGEVTDALREAWGEHQPFGAPAAPGGGRTAAG
ncbi:MAG: methylmalonyl-CoA mutase family protein [Dehalococcoidia bacterium]